MDKEEVEKRNLAILKYLGYKYTYFAEEDFSDIGGLYTNCIYYSKIPLEFEDNSLKNKYIQPEYSKDYLIITPSGWDILELELPYHKNLNSLIPVLLKILHERSSCGIISGGTYCSHGNSFSISILDDEITNYQADSDPGNEIEAIFKVVSDYCLDYNTKKSKENV